MTLSLRQHLRDPHLWTQSLLTIGATAVVSLAINGALATPTTLGEPSPSLPVVTASHAPSLPLTGAVPHESE